MTPLAKSSKYPKTTNGNSDRPRPSLRTPATRSRESNTAHNTAPRINAIVPFAVNSDASMPTAINGRTDKPVAQVNSRTSGRRPGSRARTTPGHRSMTGPMQRCKSPGWPRTCPERCRGRWPVASAATRRSPSFRSSDHTAMVSAGMKNNSRYGKRRFS